MESNLLNAPCVFCEYDGELYWQIETHDEKCPWYMVGGEKDRASLLPYVIRNLYNLNKENKNDL